MVLISFLIYQGEEDGKGVFIAQVAGKKYLLRIPPRRTTSIRSQLLVCLRYKFADKGKEEDGDDLGDLGGDLGGDDVGDLGAEEPTAEPAAEPAGDDLGDPATVEDL